jgi:PAS domain S-box-containing protein
MGPVTVLYTAFASIALFTCFLQLFLALKKRGDRLILISAVLSFVVFARYSLIFLCSSPLGIANHHMTFWRCQLILTQSVTICLIGVIFYLLKDARKVIVFLHVVFICLLVILSFLIPDNLLFGNDEGINLLDLSNSDKIPIIGKGFTWWRAITDMTMLMFAFSTVMLLMKGLKTAHHKKIIVLFSGTGLILLAALFDHFIDFGLIRSVYLLPFAVFSLYLILNFIPFLYLLEEVAENNKIIMQEIKWQNLVNEADVIVVGLNRMGHVEFINPFFLELTGYQEDEVIGKDWFEFFLPPNVSYTVQGAFIEILNFEFHPHYNNPILTKSKEEKMIRWFNVRTRDQHENITGSVSIGVDVTEDLREKEDVINKLKVAQDLIDNLKINGKDS